jgi:hypothetical protein
MPRNRKQRRTEDLRAMEVLARHLKPIMAIVAQSIAEVDPGQLDLPSYLRDARLVLDIARRLDEAVPTPEPIETWDGLLWTLVAAAALALHRRTGRSLDRDAKLAQRAGALLSRAQERAAAK